MAPGPTLKGYLYVIIVEAKNLPNTGDGVDAIDSYCAVFLDGMEEGCTVPAFDTRTPIWNKKIKIKVIGSYDTMDLQLFDADKTDEDDNHLGIAHITLSDVIDEQPHDMWLDLEKREHSMNTTPVSGSVHVMVQYRAYRKGQKSKGPATPKAEASKENEAVEEDDESETEEERKLAHEAAAAEKAAMKAEAEAKAEAAKAEAERLAEEQAHKEFLIAQAEAKAAREKAAHDAKLKAKKEQLEADRKAAEEAALREKEAAEAEARVKAERAKAAAEAKKKADAAALRKKRAAELRKKRAAQEAARRERRMKAYLAKQKAATEARLAKLKSQEEQKKAAIARAQRLAAEKRWAERKKRALALARQKHLQEQARRQRLLEEQARRRAAQQLMRQDMRGFSLFGGLLALGRGRRNQARLQMRKPQVAGKGVVCARNHQMALTIGGRGYERGYRCDGCGSIGRHHRYHCAGCKYDLCKQCARADNPSVPVCSKGHALKRVEKLKGAYRRGYRCDKCAGIKRRGARMHCERCHFDVCMGCAGKCIPVVDDSDSSDDSSESFSDSDDAERGRKW